MTLNIGFLNLHIPFCTICMARETEIVLIRIKHFWALCEAGDGIVQSFNCNMFAFGAISRTLETNI